MDVVRHEDMKLLLVAAVARACAAKEQAQDPCTCDTRDKTHG